jgi:hypothetical protein
LIFIRVVGAPGVLDNERMFLRAAARCARTVLQPATAVGTWRKASISGLVLLG